VRLETEKRLFQIQLCIYITRESFGTIQTGFMNRFKRFIETISESKLICSFQYGWCIVGLKRIALWAGTPTILVVLTCARFSFLECCKDYI